MRDIPTLLKLLADGGYAWQKLKTAIAHIDRLSIDIIERCDAGKFVILPRRWIVERTLVWLNRCQRLEGLRDTVAAATPNRTAAARQLIPSSTAASARDRKFIDNGLPIQAGLHPTSTVNQISASV